MIPKKMQDQLKNLSIPFIPGIYKGQLIALVAAAIVVPLLILAIPYLDLLNDMAVQPKGKTQALYGGLLDAPQVVERKPVEGTLPMGYIPYPWEGKDEATQKLAEAALENPFKPTMERLEEGKKLFNYYCITCHGAEGQGDGPIIGPEQFPAPPSLHTDAAREFKDGRIYHNIMRGQNTMPGHADKFDPEERWAIVMYVRALQRALHPKPEDLKK
jgi:hypothetical protein